MPKVKPIPEGYHTITPSLIVEDGVRALDFYKRAFGAVETMRMDDRSPPIASERTRTQDFVPLSEAHRRRSRRARVDIAAPTESSIPGPSRQFSYAAVVFLRR